MKPSYDFYENGFGYIRLENLDLDGLPETLTVDGSKLVRKPEFHISLVWVGRLSEMIDKKNQAKIKKEMLEEFDKFTAKHSLKDYMLTKELRLVKRGEQKSVIAMAGVKNLDVFFEKLCEKYGVDLPLQPAHITLYTLPTDKIGIGILSYGELDELSEPVDIPGIQRLL